MKVSDNRERILSKIGTLNFRPVEQTIRILINNKFITMDSGYGNFILNKAFMKNQGFIDYQSGAYDLSGLLTNEDDIVQIDYQYEDEGEKS